MGKDAKPHPVVASLALIFLLTFFGGGLAMFINLFVPFLGEAAAAIISIVLFAELAILLVAGKSMQVIERLRRNAVSSDSSKSDP